ncbi:MAG: ATP-binding cassette domain-containing protein [Gemmatimonadota bacterium]
MTTSPPPILEMQEIEKHFGPVRAVDGVSVTVRRGEIVALLGPNGAGKTTLLRIALGMIRPDRGWVAYGLGGGLSDRPDARRIGYLPEERGLYQDVPVARYLAYFGALRGMRRSDARREAARWLERLDLADRARERLRNLSKGNQQKVQFISTVVHRPELAILDEPFSGLDPLNQDLFLSLIRELRDAGTTVILSAHHMQLVERLADRVVLIRKGRVADSGTVEELRRRWGAGRRLVVRLGGGGAGDGGSGAVASPGDGRAQEGTAGDVAYAGAVAFLESLAGVRSARATAAGEIEIDVEPDASLSGLLEAIGGRLDVQDLRTETVTLHDIYVRTMTGVEPETEEVVA